MHLSYATEKSYAGRAQSYIRALPKYPKEWTSKKTAEAFLTELAKRDVAATTQNQALNAIAFLYKDVLGTPLGTVDALRVRRPAMVREALSIEDTRALLGAMEDVGGYPTRLIVRLLYGCGLRMIAGTGANAVFASEQARQALDVFVQEIENWHWTEREGERPGPAFRMKASASAGRAAELAGLWLPDALTVKYPRQLSNGAGSGFFHPGASAPIRGPACAVATMCMRTGSARRLRRLANAPGSTSRSRPTRCGIASPRICWRPGPTSGPCRNCSATRASRPR